MFDRLSRWFESVGRDARIAARVARRSPLVAAAATASLSLALGASIASFALVDALILRPLPVTSPERLVYLSYPKDAPAIGEVEAFSDPLFVRLRDAARGRADLFAMSVQAMRRSVVDAGSGAREALRTQFVSGDAFAQLGVRAAAGRTILPADDDRSAVPVAVLSYAVWQRRFGGDPSAIGRAIAIEERSYEIVGVADRTFTGVEPGRPTDVWVPYAAYDPAAFGSAGYSWFRIFGRLHDGTEPQAAQAVMQAAFTAFRRDYAERLGSGGSPQELAQFVGAPLRMPSAASGPSPLRTQFERPLWVLAATALLLLVMAASNLANLFLARTTARDREMALRVSIGAGRGRLVQQVLVESALIAVPACALGLAFALAAAPAVVAMTATASDPIHLDLHVGWRLIAAASALTAMATALLGWLPAMRAAAASPGTLLKADGAGAGRTARALRPFVALQTATGTIVLFVGALLISSFARLSAVDPGFAGDVLLVSLEPAPRTAPARQREALLDVLDRVRRVPGVQAVSASESSPLGRSWTSNMRVPGRADAFVDATVQPVSAGYFEIMRIPIVAGRGFEARDLADADSRALVVNDAFARAYFGGAPAVGQTLRKRFFDRTSLYEIVGVAGDTRYDLRQAPVPTIYVRLSMRANVTLQVRAAGAPVALAARVRDQVRGAGPVFRVTTVTTEAAAIAETLLRERLLALLAGFFGAVGLALAAVGLFGVLSYTVAQRTREIGIRAALGARPLHAVRLITVDAGAPVLAGIAAGLACGVYLARFVAVLLYDVRPLAAGSLAWPIGVLLVTAIAAAIVPLLRALRLSPADALRDTL